jgi:hypothetical protein
MTKTQLFSRISNCRFAAKRHYDDYVLHKHIFNDAKRAALELQKHDYFLAEAEICKLVLQSDY